MQMEKWSQDSKQLQEQNTGRFIINGEYYYAASSGVISAQWVKSGNNWYYVDANGKMVTGDYKINEVVNRFDANGVWHGVWLG